MPCMDQKSHRRRSLRLRGYDYSQAGAYFVTVCAHNRICFFGDISAGIVQLNDSGMIAQETWIHLAEHYSNLTFDAFVVMPNHIHGILVLADDLVGAGLKPAPTQRHALPEIIRAFKTFSARRINACRGTLGVPVWQRNYYEHIIRNEKALTRIRQYIAYNPARWADDPENPDLPVAARVSNAPLVNDRAPIANTVKRYGCGGQGPS
jgi:putative transposase